MAHLPLWRRNTTSAARGAVFLVRDQMTRRRGSGISMRCLRVAISVLKGPNEEVSQADFKMKRPCARFAGSFLFVRVRLSFSLQSSVHEMSEKGFSRPLGPLEIDKASMRHQG